MADALSTHDLPPLQIKDEPDNGDAKAEEPANFAANRQSRALRRISRGFVPVLAA